MNRWTKLIKFTKSIKSISQSVSHSVNDLFNQPINQYYKATVIVIVTVKSNVYCLMIEYAYWNSENRQ